MKPATPLDVYDVTTGGLIKYVNYVCYFLLFNVKYVGSSVKMVISSVQLKFRIS